jgi:SAM-dependent methyltransferase
MKMSAKSTMYSKHAQLMACSGTNYSDYPHDEVLYLIPEEVERILEVGCGGGATLRALRESRTAKGRVCELVGVDIEAGAVLRAREHLDAAYLMDAEEDELVDFPPGYFDLLIMHYVLEHFVNPWATLRQWLPLVRPGGYVIVGVPNVTNYRVLRRLIFRDEFAYEPLGILDWTHLRHFTKRTFINLLEEAGLTPVRLVGLPMKEWMPRRTRRFIGLFPSAERFIYFGYVMLAEKNQDPPSNYLPFEETYTLPIY